MRSLLIVMLFGAVAFADAPRGRYRLEVTDGAPQFGARPPKDPLPSCGRRAVDFMATIGTLKVEVVDDITVNGIVWKPFPTLPKALSAVNNQLLEGFTVQVTFFRAGEIARGFLVVVGLANDVAQCHDARVLEGRYRR